VFDLAVVYNAYRDDLLKNVEAFAKELPTLAKQIDAIERSGEFENRIRAYSILPGGEKIRGEELALCKEFIESAEQTLNNIFLENSTTTGQRQR
jgi:hypothetical protein